MISYSNTDFRAFPPTLSAFKISPYERPKFQIDEFNKEEDNQKKQGQRTSTQGPRLSNFTYAQQSSRGAAKHQHRLPCLVPPRSMKPGGETKQLVVLMGPIFWKFMNLEVYEFHHFVETPVQTF
jgi:hypothetical protein